MDVINNKSITLQNKEKTHRDASYKKENNVRVQRKHIYTIY